MTLTDHIKRLMPPRGVTANEMLEILQKNYVKNSFEEVQNSLRNGTRHYQWNCDYKKVPPVYFPRTFKGE